MENSKIIKAVVEEMPKELGDKIRGLDGAELLSVFEEFPTVKNEFISTLTNKVTKSLIYSKIYENPLVELKQGLLPIGESIEELFVQMAQMKNFGENWNEDGSAEADLIRELKPKVTALYIQRNIDKKFKTTVNDKQLRKAFLSEQGLGRLIQQIVGSITNSINYNEFEMMKSTLFRAVDGLTYEGKDLITTLQNKQKVHSVEVDYSNPANLVEAIRTTVGEYKFMSDKFNMAKEKTFSNPQDLVLITTPSVNAKLDVHVLAHAFNVSHTDIKTRTIEVDKLDLKGANGKYTTKEDGIIQDITCSNSALPSGKKPLAILIDKEFLQIWDTYQGAGTFYNPERQYTNHFANREYIMATCLFANATLFYA